MRQLFFISVIWVTSLTGYAQPPVTGKKADSLLARLHMQTARDTNRVNTLLALAQLYTENQEQRDLIIPGAREALGIASELSNPRQQSMAALIISNGLFNKAEYRAALPYADSALLFALRAGHKKLEVSANFTSGLIYFFLEAYPLAAKHFYAALSVAEQIHDNRLVGSCYGLIGACFSKQNKLSDAILFSRKGIAVDREKANPGDLANSLNAMSEIFIRLNQLDSAFRYNREAEVLNNSLGATAPVWQAGYIWGVRALLFENRGDNLKNAGAADSARFNYRVALQHYLLHLSEIKRIDSLDQFPLAATMIGTISVTTGRTYFKLGDTRQARKYTEEGIRICLAKGVIEELAIGYSTLSSLDSLQGNFAGSLHNYRLSRKYFDSIYNAENSRLVEQYKNQNDFEKREKDLELQISEEKLKSALAQKRKQQLLFTWVIGGLLLTGAVLAFFRYRRYLQEKSEQQLLRERLAISQDLHDHVGSTLSSISVYSKVAQIQGEENKKEEMNELLGRIRSTSNTMVTEMNDIVWAINPVNDSMEKIIQRMDAYARPLLHARNMKFSFVYDASLFTSTMEMEKRKNFYLIFKEAVTNAVKYSAASSVDTRLHRQNGNLVLEIRDNGIGFNTAAVVNVSSLSGNGLRNMQQRAKTIGGRLSIESQPGSGTRISLYCPA